MLEQCTINPRRLMLAAAVLVGLTSCARTLPPDGHVTASHPSMATVLFIDFAYAEDVQMLVDQATLVVVGTPVGEPEEVALDQQGGSDLLANYPQTIRVEEVLFGDTPADTVRIARTGVSTKGRAQGVVAEEVGGPLPPGQHVLFLMPSGDPAFYQVVGHASGALPLDAARRITTTRPETRDLDQLSVPELRRKLRDLQPDGTQ